MKNIWKIFIIAVAFIAIGGLVGFYFIGKTSSYSSRRTTDDKQTGKVAGATTIESDNYSVNLAKDLTQKGVIFYGSYQSVDSQKQKKLFGDAAQYLNYVECDTSGHLANSDECAGNNVTVYPSWFYQGKLYTGVQSLATLANIINFSQ